MSGSGAATIGLAHSESPPQATARTDRIVCAITEVMVSSQSLEQIGTGVAALVGAALSATRTDLWCLDRERGRLTLEARWHLPDEVVNAPSGPSELALSMRPDLEELLEGRAGTGGWRDDMAASGTGCRRSILEVPLVFRKEVVGLLTADRDAGVGASVPDDRGLLDVLRPQIGRFVNEIVQARCREADARQRKAILKASWAVNSLVASAAVLKWLTREAMEGMNVSRATTYLYDATADTLVLESTCQAEASGSSESEPKRACKLDDHIGEWQILSQPNVVLEQVATPALPADRRETMRALGEMSALSVPIWFNNLPLGILRCSQVDSPRTFSDSEIELAVALAQQAAVAVNNAAAVERRRINAGRLSHMVRACRSMSEEVTVVNVDSAMTMFARDLLEAFDEMTGVDVYEYLADDEAIRVRYSLMPACPEEAAEFVGTEYSLDERPSYRRAFLPQRVVEYHVNDKRFAGTDPELRAEMIEWGEQNVIEVGLMCGGQVTGLLSLSSTRDVGFLNDDEKNLLLAFAAVGARLMKSAA